MLAAPAANLWISGSHTQSMCISSGSNLSICT